MVSVNWKVGDSSVGLSRITSLSRASPTSMAPSSSASSIFLSRPSMPPIRPCRSCPRRCKRLSCAGAGAGAGAGTGGSGPAAARPRSSVQPRACASRATVRSATEAMVSSGFTPTGPGITAPSHTYSPGYSASAPCPAGFHTWPRSFTTPFFTSSAMPQPPTGCTVTSWWPIGAVHSGLGMNSPWVARAASCSLALSRTTAAFRPAPGHSISSRSSASFSRPPASSTLITR